MMRVRLFSIFSVSIIVTLFLVSNAHSSLLDIHFNFNNSIKICNADTHGKPVKFKLTVCREKEPSAVTGLTRKNFKLVGTKDFVPLRKFVLSVAGGANGIYSFTIWPEDGNWMPSSYSSPEYIDIWLLINNGTDAADVLIDIAVYPDIAYGGCDIY